ncbi:hypothetical protein FRAAL6662 [Frankia alni ACN14a]|uniref:Uncharacterized protein n=1 Tax=Frankia alni (strain DSM 45986 / CECT 9034 / ACN14a) TaxID=326424 RepID=Q0RBA1_FRAAA|nr:hypothetical protein FRAAL6662 [Frankia alni ACN14a]
MRFARSEPPGTCTTHRFGCHATGTGHLMISCALGWGRDPIRPPRLPARSGGRGSAAPFAVPAPVPFSRPGAARRGPVVTAARGRRLHHVPPQRGRGPAAAARATPSQAARRGPGASRRAAGRRPRPEVNR